MKYLFFHLEAFKPYSVVNMIMFAARQRAARGASSLIKQIVAKPGFRGSHPYDAVKHTLFPTYSRWLWGVRLRKHNVGAPSWRSMTTGMLGRPRVSGRDAQTLKQTNAPKPSANILVNETSSFQTYRRKSRLAGLFAPLQQQGVC